MVSAHSRGQAAVELALGLLVFVTILIFGIFFAEIGYLTLKVTEANSSAIWHATAAKMHTLPKDFSDVRELISNDSPGSAATGLYNDFDGRTTTTGSNEVKLTFAKASGLQVTCEAGSPSFAPPPTTEDVYEDVGGMRCRSQATMDVVDLFPKSFLDTGEEGFFKERHYDMTELRICGVNRSSSCESGFAILLDDWGLASDEELNECEVLDGSGCDNGPYYRSTQRVYQAHLPGLGAAVDLARSTVGGVPGGFDPANFYMSFRVFQEREPGGDADPNDWVTTPGRASPSQPYDVTFEDRGECFAGKRCN